MKQRRSSNRKQQQKDAPSAKANDPKGEKKPNGIPCIVGIGSSAGGVEALQELFTELPTTDGIADGIANGIANGIAYVVVHHFAHDAITQLPELIARQTSMSVISVDEEMRVEADHVYVIAPGTQLSIEHGVLLPSPIQAPLHAHGTIDLFLRALAEDQGKHAICIILSGAGSDGTLGLKAIEAAGGMTIVQDPDTATHNAMPRSAMRSGIVDYVVPISRMAEILTGYVQHPYVQSNRDTAAVLTETEEIDSILALLRIRIGYNFTPYKKTTLIRRMQRRMGLKHIETISEYTTLLRDNRDEMLELFKNLLLCVTDFYRDPEAWQILKEDVIRPLVQECDTNAAIRVWVAGCATGEEAYSVAMMLIDQVRAEQKNCTIQVFASDINPTALQKAREGIYPATIAADIPPDYLQRFFTELPEDNHYQISKQVRECIVFAEQNLITDPPFSKLDLICCRNLLIYLEPDVQRKVISLFHFALRPNGYMFLGTAESIAQHEEMFRSISKKWRIYQRIGMMRRDMVSFPVISSESMPVVAALEPRSSHAKLTTVAQHILLERFAPASVLINRKMDILFFSGPTHDYLMNPTGAATHNLLAMAREGLRTKLRAAVHQALQSEQPVRITDIHIKRGTSFHPIRLTINPLNQLGQEGLLLIVFEEENREPIEASDQTDLASAHDTLVRQLEYDLKITRDDLQSNIEELETSNEDLKAANEEVMSINEELQTANEELETSKEELQSLNEELMTVNHQLQAKLEELEQSNNDLHNLLTSTDIATIFLDTRLCITRFTPAMTRLMHLIPSDIGRPVSVFAQQFTEQGLVEDAQKVLQYLMPIETEVQTTDGRWLIRRTLPYRTEDNRIEGVVVTFIDISERMRITSALNESEESFKALVDMVRDYAILKLDLEGCINFWNVGAERVLGWSEKEILGQSCAIIFTPEDREQGVPEQEIRTAAEKGTASDARWHLRRDGSRFWAMGRMIALYDDHGTLTGFCKVMRDMTIEKELGMEIQNLNETLEQRITDRTEHAERLAGNLRTLNAELLLAENRDRRQLAADLHDDLGQVLTLAKMRLSSLKQMESRTRKSPAHSEALTELERLVNQAIRSVRSFTFQLSPPILHELGLIPALQWLGEEMGQQYGLSVLVEDDGAPKPINENTAFMVFRSVRELLINVVKHAEATRATVDSRRVDDMLIIRIGDNGKGFDTDAVITESQKGGYGLFSTRERLSYLGGKMDLLSTPELGTTVTLTVPLAGEQQSEEKGVST